MKSEDIRIRREKKQPKREQISECRFYDDRDGKCRITKGGELICSYKRCTLFIEKEER